ncbi:hypothetical protein Q3Y59_15095 [Bacillus velezensis]|nr:hypothetical protein [Bacillus velezensis]WKW10730.1 hypothetical protein Q3Y59_15095 [Bacillus velezensis]
MTESTLRYYEKRDCCR